MQNQFIRVPDILPTDNENINETETRNLPDGKLADRMVGDNSARAVPLVRSRPSRKATDLRSVVLQLDAWG
jgi:hypothetical protein